MFSAFFIRRPIFAAVISILIVLAGLAAIRTLAIEQYPQLVPPLVQVSTAYPGATAEVIAATVAAPLEQAINGVDNMLYINSTSSNDGSVSIAVTFAIGTDPDQATINVNNRVQSALTQLPASVQRQGVNVQKKSSNFLQVITLDSPSNRYDSLFISNYALINIVDELKRIPGVGDAVIFGAKDYSMRIWLQPEKLAQFKLTTDDISAAINEQNAQFAAGKIGADPTNQPLDFTYTVTTQGRLTTPEAFGDIILRSNSDGSKIRLKDVARVELGARDYTLNVKHNGKPSIAVGIFLSPGANQLSVAESVNTAMAELATRFPEGLTYAVPYDTTKFVKTSIQEVVKTLMEAMVLVFLVVYLFLQNWRATLIPCLAVPVSIIGTFAGMYLMGFTINTLTMFGMVLAIGIVVDDAIVVLENVERIMSQEKLGSVEATLKAMTEVTGPVVAIVLVLCAVFVPVAFMGGLAGQMYKQFAATIAVSVVISGIVALTLTPALCALMLKPGHQHPHAFFVRFNTWFDRMTEHYTAGVRYFLKRSVRGLLIFAALIVGVVLLFRTIPTSLAPDEDQGYVIAAAFLPDASSLARTQQVTDHVDQALLANKAVEATITFAGYDLLTGTTRTNTGVTFVPLKPWDERKAKDEAAQSIVGYIFGVGSTIRQAMVIAFNPPPISGMSNTGGFQGYVQDRTGGSPQALAAATKKLVEAGQSRPELTGVSTPFSANVPQIYLELDREKAKAYGVNITSVFETMQSTFGALYVNDFTKFSRNFRVQLQSEADFRSKPGDIGKVYVRSQTGTMIPLSTLITVKQVTGPEVMQRYNIFPAAQINGGPAAGYSSGQSIAAMNAVAKAALPEGYTLAWTGSAFQETEAGGTSTQAFVFGLIMVFLILAAQYEKWSLPFAVLMAVPFAVFGALLANYMRGLANDVFFQIALVTLIGLAAKNAILIIEFATMKYEEGLSVIEAATQAARLRFRPIIMTSLAFVLGCVPLAISSGAGAASRHSIGTGVIGGMLAATFVATFFIPMFFKLIMGRSKKKTPPPNNTQHEEQHDA